MGFRAEMTLRESTLVEVYSRMSFTGAGASDEGSTGALKDAASAKQGRAAGEWAEEPALGPDTSTAEASRAFGIGAAAAAPAEGPVMGRPRGTRPAAAGPGEEPAIGRPAGLLGAPLVRGR